MDQQRSANIYAKAEDRHKGERLEVRYEDGVDNNVKALGGT
jgi:hypothetical protein